ncbi:uncharacterized protein LOC125047264 [Penaeus chinensis]|uniref:uncharacterized protein LOC125047264 n=1 Tax=Penaeus chinensis TaxID=139456 RepID=UPI001FB61939|nr:uncharacterized protein LOC125047264 [Penaeus chinensis]
MAAVDIPLGPVMSAPIVEPPPQFVNPRMQRLLNRKRRMNFFDLANLLDSDGNLQNEMMVFAFAATMLSTIPVLLGNEFDVNVGLRRKRQTTEDPDDSDESSYLSYATQPDDDSEPQPFFSASTYKKIMTAPPGTKDFSHIYNGSITAPDPFDAKDSGTRHYGQESAVADTDMMELLRELLIWSHEKTKDKTLLPMLINLALDRYGGNTNPADKLVRVAYKKWKNFW